MKSRSRQDQPIEALVERLRDGTDREESFRLLFDRFYWPLFRFFEGRGFSTEERQDLIQETFLRVFQGIEGFRGDARWEHWLFRIAANTASKAIRHGTATKRAGRTVLWDDASAEDAALSSGGPGTETPGPLRQVLSKESKELLRRAIAGLPAQMRRCVRLRVFQDLDHEEIGQILRISPSTVKVQLFKARKRLLMELGDSVADVDL